MLDACRTHPKGTLSSTFGGIHLVSDASSSQKTLDEETKKERKQSPVPSKRKEYSLHSHSSKFAGLLGILVIYNNNLLF